MTELIGELAECEPSADGLIGLRKFINLAEAEFCREVRAFDARQEYAAVGRVARMLPALPETEAAFAAGDISYSHVAQLTELARKWTWSRPCGAGGTWKAAWMRRPGRN